MSSIRTYCTASSPPVAQSGQVLRLRMHIVMAINILVHSEPIQGAAKNFSGQISRFNKTSMLF